MLGFWNELSKGRKTGLVAGAAAVLIGVGVGTWWLLSSSYETVLRANSPEKIVVAVREIEKMKVPYQVAGDGLSVAVPHEEVGQVKVRLAGQGVGGDVPGFELFNNTDFSTTEFTQKINFQRALQGELARTIAAIDGVASTRVHVVLPDSGFLRRKSVPPTAAINIAMEPGAQLTAAQVHGIQKLVAAAVPELKVDDITVVDQDGIALTQAKSGAADGGRRGQLELKREVDTYLEGKLRRVLSGLDPQGEFNISVDATLSASDQRVTTEDVVPAVDGTRGGVVVRERQSQRHDSAGGPDASASSPSSGSVIKEVEYKVGHRVEQTVTGPGNVERISVAVLVRSGNLQTDAQSLRKLIANAVGAKEEDGDSIAVVLLPTLPHETAGGAGTQAFASDGPPAKSTKILVDPAAPGAGRQVITAIAWLGAIVAFAALAWVAWRRQGRDTESQPGRPLSDQEVEEVAQRVNAWLSQEQVHASR